MSHPLSDVSIGGFVPGHSLLHRLDPRTKLVGIILLLIGVFGFRSVPGAAFSGACVLGIAALSGAGWRIWFWGLSRFRWMLAITFTVNLFFHSGGTFILIGDRVLPFTSEAAKSSVVLTVQLLAAVVLSMGLTFTTTSRELTKACEWMAGPLKRFKIPVDDLAVVILMSMRFVPLLHQELRNIVDAQKARGVDFSRGSVSTRAGNLVAVLVPAVLGTLRRGEVLALAMTARGFRPGNPRSDYNPLNFCLRDWAGLAFSVSFLFCHFIINS
jgi:energy-coupling factor transport system permease protein